MMLMMMKRERTMGAVVLLMVCIIKAEICKPTELMAMSSFHYIMYNSTTEDHCAWIIRGAVDGDVIGIRITDWFTPSGFSCTRDRLVIRDGADIASPYLRVVCGTTCDALNDVTEVVTSSGAARVIYFPFEFNSLQPRGFTLVYRSLTMNPVGRQAVMYTGVNYVLMCASVLVIGGLLGGILFLYLRELGMTRRKKRQDRLGILMKRRQGISGQSGIQSRVGSGVSTHPDHPFGLETNTTQLESDEEEDWRKGREGEAREEEEDSGLIPDTERTHVSPHDGDVTSRFPNLSSFVVQYDDDVTSQVFGMTDMNNKGHMTTSQTPNNRTHVQYDKRLTSQTVMAEVVGP